MFDRRCSGRRQGFTLIELLVVIAIIAILAAILFPVFAAAKNSAHRTACLNNMSQLGKAVKLYEQDNSGLIFPGGYPYDSVVDAAPVISAYLKYLRTERAFMCPADRALGYNLPPGPYRWPHTCSYAYQGYSSTGGGRNLDQECGTLAGRTQAVWVFSDVRYNCLGKRPNGQPQPRLFDFNSNGAQYTATAHAKVVWLGSNTSQQYYIPGLMTMRLYVDSHVVFQKGWQRYAFGSSGEYLGNMP